MLDRRCVWDAVEISESKGFQDTYRKRDNKSLLDSMGIWHITFLRILKDFRIFIRKRVIKDYYIVSVFEI